MLGNTNFKKILLDVLNEILDINLEKDIVFIKDSDFKYVYVNNRFCEIFSLDQNTVIGKCDNNFIQDKTTLENCYLSDCKAFEDNFIIIEETTFGKKFNVLKLKINLGHNKNGILCLAKEN